MGRRTCHVRRIVIRTNKALDRSGGRRVFELETWLAAARSTWSLFAYEKFRLPLNPYESPETASRKNSGRPTHWYYSVVAPISVMAFWLGVILGILGSFISFVPGGEAYWFAFTSIFIACGLFANGSLIRIAAFVLLALCLIATYNGYVRGIEYQEFLRTRPN